MRSQVLCPHLPPPQITAIGTFLLGPAVILIVCMGLGVVRGLVWERILTFDLLLTDALFMYFA
jgi:hypothetical protein